MRATTGARGGHIKAAFAIAATAVALVAAGCGDDDEATPATGGSSGGDSAQSGQFPALEKVVAQYEQVPTKISVTEPLPRKPAAGKTIVFIECDVPQCQQQGQGIKDSAQSVGWKYESIQFKTADPATLITAMKDALAFKPVAVVFSGTPEPLWAQMKPAYEKAGVAIVPLFVGPAAIEGPVIGSIGGELDNQIAGKVMADWFIVNSAGKGKALLQTVPGFPAITLWKKYFQAEVEKECPGCSVKAFDVAVADLADGSSTSKTVGALQRETETTHVFAYNGNFVPNISGELRTANITDVKLGTYAATSELVTQAAQGQDFALMANNNEYSGWLAADMAMRHSLGVEQSPERSFLPVQLLTKRSATEELAKEANAYQRPEGYRDQFKQLWGAGS